MMDDVSIPQDIDPMLEAMSPITCKVKTYKCNDIEPPSLRHIDQSDVVVEP